MTTRRLLLSYVIAACVLSGCDSNNSLLSSFGGNSSRPKQVVDGPRRAPLLQNTPPSAPAPDFTMAAPVQEVHRGMAPPPGAMAAAPPPPPLQAAPVQMASSAAVLTSPTTEVPPARFGDEDVPPKVAVAKESPTLWSTIGGWFGNKPEVSEQERTQAYSARKALPGNPPVPPTTTALPAPSPLEVKALDANAQPLVPGVPPGKLPFEVKSAEEERASAPPQPGEHKEKKIVQHGKKRHYAGRHHHKHYAGAHHKKTKVAKKKDGENNLQVADQKNQPFPSLNNVPPTPKELQQVKQGAPAEKNILEQTKANTDAQKKAVEAAPFESLQSSSSGAPVPPPAPPAPQSPAPVVPPPAMPVIPAGPSNSGADKPAMPAAPAPSAPAPAPTVPLPPAPPPPPPPPPPPGASLPPVQEESHMSEAALVQESPAAGSLPEWAVSRASEYLPQPHFVTRAMAVSLGHLLLQ